METTKIKPRIVIIGAGFGGLFATKELVKKPVEVILIDRNNFHTFTPLMYQVATCGLDPSDIAHPIRTIFRNEQNIHFLLGTVTELDYENKSITVQSIEGTRQETYDYLILATGTETNFFGKDDLQKYTFGLKSLEDAIEIRHHILKLFEKAAWEDDLKKRQALTTFTVVGGGATGIETAGALYELYSYILKQEYDDRHKIQAKVILLEGQDKLLAPYPTKLQGATKKQLEDIGVEVRLNTMVEEVYADHIILKDGERLDTHTVIWAAGVKTSALLEQLDVELERMGRIPVDEYLQVKDRTDIYAIGDIAYLLNPDGEPYPMLIPVAKQQGSLVAKNIIRHLHNHLQDTFSYNDRGIMATIGRSRAVAWLFYRYQLTGFLAWQSWLWLHLVMLMGFKNRISVFISWVWNYFNHDRSVRIILRDKEE